MASIAASARPLAVALDHRAALALLALAAFALRLRFLGDPALHVDETFYLVVGDRMLDGAWPYVDIWDRKPMGLFLIYAAIRLLGGSGILEYQLVATLFAGATAMIVYRLTRLWAAALPSLAAGIAYLIWLNVYQGWGGQAPVFYNLPVAAAAWLTLAEVRRTAAGEAASGLVGRGAMAMLLLGLAIQIKYTVVFEGAAMGLAWLWCRWRAAPDIARLLVPAALWIALALAPTAAVWLVYAAHGHGDAFLHANFISIFEKGASTDARAVSRLQRISAGLGTAIMLVTVAALRAMRTWPALAAPERAVVVGAAGWLAAALVGFASVGNFYHHYTLPLLTPLCIVAFWGLPSGVLGAVVAALVLGQAAVLDVLKFEARARLLGEGRVTFAMVEAIRPHLKGGPLFVFDGPPSLYLLTGAAAPTRYAFPYHLNMALEAPSLGVDPVAETRRALARRPDVVVTADRPAVGPNRAVWALVRRELAAHYREVARIPYGERTILIYASSTGRTS